MYQLTQEFTEKILSQALTYINSYDTSDIFYPNFLKAVQLGTPNLIDLGTNIFRMNIFNFVVRFKNNFVSIPLTNAFTTLSIFLHNFRDGLFSHEK